MGKLTDGEMLEALVKKAIEAGWDDNPPLLQTLGYLPRECNVVEDSIEADDERAVDCFLFNHDFARALFGEDLWHYGYKIDMTIDPPKTSGSHWFAQSTATGGGMVSHIHLRAFQYHLQQAVISDNPVRYLYNAVYGKEETPAV